jgi:hypothetical protein
MCEHNEEMKREYAGLPMLEPFCGNDNLHTPHDGCLGLMCDYGCNAEYF